MMINKYVQINHVYFMDYPIRYVKVMNIIIMLALLIILNALIVNQLVNRVFVRNNMEFVIMSVVSVNQYFAIN